VNHFTYLIAVLVYESIFAVALGAPAFLLWFIGHAFGAPPAVVWTIGAFAFALVLSSVWLARAAAHCLAYQDELFVEAAVSAVRMARDELASLPLVGPLFASRSQPPPSED